MPKIIVEFESWIELEEFRVSGRKSRGKKEEATEEFVAEVKQIASEIPTVAPTPAPQQPIAPTPAPPPPTPMHGFPGASGNGAMDPRITAILARIDGAISSGQPTDNIVLWFRQQIGPEAANATLDQLKQVFIPRLTEMQLNQIAPLLGFQR